MSKVVDIRTRKTVSNDFEAMMQPHFKAIYAAARRLTNSSSDAEDLVQEVCLKAYLKIQDFRQLEYQRAWLLRVLYNLFIDSQRRNQRSPLTFSDDLDEPGHLSLVDETRGPAEEVDRMIQISAIVNAMNMLTKEECSLLALHDIEGFTISELMDVTGLAEGTIKSKLHRSRVKLGKLLRNKVFNEIQCENG